jgi:hypothetical protein
MEVEGSFDYVAVCEANDAIAQDGFAQHGSLKTTRDGWHAGTSREIPRFAVENASGRDDAKIVSA